MKNENDNLPKPGLHKFHIQGFKQPKKTVWVKSFKSALGMMRLQEGHENSALHASDCPCFKK